MAKRYAIRYTTSAARALKKLPLPLRFRITRAVETLADNPFPPAVRKLKGEEHAYRIRIGDYRVVYDVVEDVLVVLVLRIGHRKDVYR